MTFPGSQADYQALEAAIEVSKRQTRVADLLKCPVSYALDNAAYLRVTELAIRCGYEWSNTVTTMEWAEKRVASFRNIIRKAA